MKTIVNRFLVLLGGALALTPLDVRANFEVSAGVSINADADFYAPLATEGAWIGMGSYGRCWRPAGVSVGWRPYCSGQWIWTDCGWYWQSDEPWAWACYHYGRWIFDPAQGWLWVPGIEWAPSWVSWRVGDGYIGWAPLGPRGAILPGPQFVFIESTHFQGAIRPNSVIINNTSIFNRTKGVNNIKQKTATVGGVRRPVMFNEGPGVAPVQKASGRTVRPVPIQEVAQHTRAPATLTHRSPSEPKTKAAPNLHPPETARATWPPPRPGANREPTTKWGTPPQVTPRSPAFNPPPTAPRLPPGKGPNPDPGHQQEPEHHEKDKP